MIRDSRPNRPAHLPAASCHRLRWGLIPAAFLLVVLSGCRWASEGEGFALRDAVEEKVLPEAFEFSHPPSTAFASVAQERRTAVFTRAEPWRWIGRLPRDARLFVGIHAIPEALETTDDFRLEVRLFQGEEEHILARESLSDGQTGWLDLEVDLSAWSRKEVTLEFSGRLPGLPPGLVGQQVLAWSPVTVTSLAGRRGAPEKPNILLVVVDTLRYDRLISYGYGRETTPETKKLLADRGTVVEHAYSQAAWTMPSMASLMTSRYPGFIWNRTGESYAIPQEATTLPELLSSLGYETGAFVGNPVLHHGNGFARGFDTFFAPFGLERLHDHADTINRRALPWLRAHQGRPFFLYVHYIDPHDPYENSDLVDGRSPFFPSYRGSLGPSSVHAMFTGHLDVEPTPEDLEHLNALYDSEVRFVDRHVGELLASLPPKIMAETLVVLTSDHGEELYEHGGWKHGETLYEEQIRVPLLFRWDGRIPAGERLGGMVELLDVPPTLVSAAGGTVPDSWVGTDLLPALTREEPPPRKIAFSERFGDRPLRVAAVDGDQKLLLFNATEPFEPDSPFQRHLLNDTLERLERIEGYDLAADPAETRNVAAPGLGDFRRLERFIHHRLDRELPGLRLVACTLKEGQTLRATVGLVAGKEPLRTAPYFLGDRDEARIEEDRVELTLHGDGLEKGILVLGDVEGIASYDASLGGTENPPLLTGDAGLRFRGAAVGPEALSARRRPSCDGAGGLRAWLPLAREIGGTEREMDPDTLEALKALGYVD